MVHKIRAVIIIIKLTCLVGICFVQTTNCQKVRTRKTKHVNLESNAVVPVENVPCTCAIFLTGQFNKYNRTEPPRGNPGIQLELMQNYPCNSAGNKQCSNRCLDAILKHLPNSPALICGTIDRDCYRERAYLFYQNCAPRWINSNLSAGREFCCENDRPMRCTKMAALIRKSLLAGNTTKTNDDDDNDNGDDYPEESVE
ncbi:follicle cell protein 3C-1 [Malaya genurostris]|uniref:follicle cell protein 3C-1 n=1 Tax=Malaya genurostris TaxID=325434 RepID=UPI0026F3B625|nr:follicle cell protein 3C-1 [Malaya genurostris]